jgi:hypothetical protein
LTAKDSSARGKEIRSFHGRFLRSKKIWLQNHATLRNAPRKRNHKLAGVSNDVESNETLRNSLGLNYKSAASPFTAIRAVVRSTSFSDKFGQ